MIARIFNQKYTLLVLGSALLSGILVYSNTFYSSFHLDDTGSIVENLAIRNISNLPAVWNFWPTRFITFLSFSLNYHFHRYSVLGYHIVNLLMHLLATVLVCWFLQLILSTLVMQKDKISKSSPVIVIFTGLIFLLHPIQTETVTYIFQRTALLAGLFMLLSLCLYLKARLLQQNNLLASRCRIFYIASFLAAIVAMFTKENSAILPLLIILSEFCFFERDKSSGYKQALLFLILLPIVPLILFSAHPVTFVDMQKFIDKPISGSHYCLTQLRVLVTYLRLLVLPINQNLDYDYPVYKSFFTLPIYSSLLFLSLILFIGIRVFRRYRLISFSIFWFFLTLLPESSIIPLKDVIFEHRLYLPMVGFSFFLASLIYYLFENRTLKSMVIALLIVTSCYAIISYRRNFIWKNEVTLWNDAVHKSPKKARPYNNRGVAYDEQNNLPQAVSDYTKAVEINPRYAEAYYNRGNVYSRQDNFLQAVSDYTKAVEINPRYAQAYCNRGIAYDKQGNLAQAVSDYTQAIAINPRYSLPHNNRGVAYGKQGDFTQASADYTQAIAINPRYAQAYNNRGIAYGKQGNLTQAISDFTKAIQIEPDFAEAYNNRGVAYDDQDNLPQAVSDFTQAIAINPRYAQAYNNRGIANGKQGNLTQAISDLTKAIEINPNYAQAYNDRGIAYYHKKEYDNAWADVHKAEELGITEDSQFLEDLKKASGRGR